MREKRDRLFMSLGILLTSICIFVMSDVVMAEETSYIDGYYKFNVIEKQDVSSAVIVDFDTGEDVVTEISIPETVTYEGVDYPVREIGKGAFSENKKLEKVIIPDSVDTIQMYAFYYCTSLVEISVPKSVTSIEESAFSNCQKLEKVNLPQNLTLLSDNLFERCFALTDVTIPESVIEIGSHTFAQCKVLKDIELPDNVKKIGVSAFYCCSALSVIDIPKGVTVIDEYTFGDCSNLQQVMLPEGLTTVGENAFCFCKSLENIVLPETVSTIGKNAFIDCDALKGVIIPDGVKELKDLVFGYCENLEYVVIPDSVTSMTNCYKYEIELWGRSDATFYKSQNVTIYCNVGSYAESYAKKNGIKCDIIDNAPVKPSYYIPTKTNETESNKTVANNSENTQNENNQTDAVVDMTGTTFVAKKANYKITKYATDGSGTVTYVKPVGSKKKLTSVTIPATVSYNNVTYKVTAVEKAAFKKYGKLKSVKIGKNVECIGKQAFYKCKNLKNISIKTTKLTKKNVGKQAFKGINAKVTIKVPKKKYKKYKSLLKARGVSSKAKIR